MVCRASPPTAPVVPIMATRRVRSVDGVVGMGTGMSTGMGMGMGMGMG